MIRNTIRGIVILSFAFVLAFMGAVAGSWLALPSQCSDLWANWTKYTPACRAAIIAQRRGA